MSDVTRRNWLDATSQLPSGTRKPAPAPKALDTRSRIDRYELLERIGAGRLGAMYGARDPHLARAVAVRWIESAAPDSAASLEQRALLLEAAQASAQLSHPNVCRVYDVGLHEGHVFVVMEYIDGEPLQDWLGTPRSRRQVLRVLLDAGRGLEAAHAAGVLHGDFNPTSVMVSRDGRGRVLDFGLVRALRFAERARTAPSAPAVDAREAAELGQAPVGVRGASGSMRSAYAAPEVGPGRPADARSDQYAFALTAFVAVTGSEPDVGAGARTRPEGFWRGTSRWPPSVPRRLRAVIDRGLSAQPTHRYPSLSALLAGLEQVASPPRRAGAALGVLGLTAAGLLFPDSVSVPAVSSQLCHVDERSLQGVWDARRRATIEAGFIATGRSNAAEAFQLVAARLDRFVGEWLDVRRSSCEATHVHRQQPERVMALRAACLDRQRAAVEGLVRALERVTATGVDRLAGALPPSLRACSDVPSLVGAAPAALDPAAQSQLEAVEVELAVTHALILAAQGPDAIQHGQVALDLARATEYPPLIASATLEFAYASYTAASTNAQRSEAEDLLKRSMTVAARAGDDTLLSRVASYLFYAMASVESRIPEAEAMLPVVEALLMRGRYRPEGRIEVLTGKAVIFSHHLQLGKAIEALDEATNIALSGDEPLRRFVINTAVFQSRNYTQIGKHEAAIAEAERSVDFVRQLYGRNHPRMLFIISNLVHTLAQAGQHERALAAVAELHRLEPMMPPEELRLRAIPFAEGAAWRRAGDCARALPFYREAQARFSRALGPEHPLTGEVVLHLGHCEVAAGQVAEGLSHLQWVLASWRKQAATPALIAEASFELAQGLWLLPTERARALGLAEEARALYRNGDVTAAAKEVERWLVARGPGDR